MSETHIMFWELFPTVDHVVPVARGGSDHADNWVTASMLRNSAKSNWTLEELEWKLVPPGDAREWDGLTSWYLGHIGNYPELSDDAYLRRWRLAAADVVRELQSNS
mgnify:FL=1